MKVGKKQLVLASLVLALGAAVYLNWQFAGTGQLPVEEESQAQSQLGAAQLVNNAYVETVNDSLESSASSQGDSAADAFSEARLNRQNSRDEALELLDGCWRTWRRTARQAGRGGGGLGPGPEHPAGDQRGEPSEGQGL